MERASTPIYLTLGWSALIAVSPLSSSLSGATLTLIAIGGLLYTLGLIFYVWERLRFQRAVWHLFVLVAASVH